MKVLIVDDDQYFIEPLMWELKNAGYDIETYGAIEDILEEDVSEKKKKLKISKPACVVLDIMMPHGKIFTTRETDTARKTGLKLLEIILREWASIPVIVLTVRDDVTLTDMKKQYGDSVKFVFYKPKEPSQVMRKIREVIGPGNCRRDV